MKGKNPAHIFTFVLKQLVKLIRWFLCFGSLVSCVAYGAVVDYESIFTILLIHSCDTAKNHCGKVTHKLESTESLAFLTSICSWQHNWSYLKVHYVLLDGSKWRCRLFCFFPPTYRKIALYWESIIVPTLLVLMIL